MVSENDVLKDLAPDASQVYEHEAVLTTDAQVRRRRMRLRCCSSKAQL